MKQFVLLYDEFVPGHGIFERGTILEASKETSSYIYVQFDDIEWRFSKTHVVEALMEREH